jgi:hypothetical protein
VPMGVGSFLRIASRWGDTERRVLMRRLMRRLGANSSTEAL